HIRDFDGTQRVRDGCTACMVDCYRDDSVMQHVGVALSDGLRAAARGDVRQAWSHWADGRNVTSLRAAIRTVRMWTRVSASDWYAESAKGSRGMSVRVVRFVVAVVAVVGVIEVAGGAMSGLPVAQRRGPGRSGALRGIEERPWAARTLVRGRVQAVDP